MQKQMMIATVGLLLTIPATSALAGPVAPGFDTIVALGPNDDDATGAIVTGLVPNYFGNTYTNTFISNNGYLTFNSGQGDYTPFGLGTGYSG